MPALQRPQHLHRIRSQVWCRRPATSRCSAATKPRDLGLLQSLLALPGALVVIVASHSSAWSANSVVTARLGGDAPPIDGRARVRKECPPPQPARVLQSRDELRRPPQQTVPLVCAALLVSLHQLAVHNAGARGRLHSLTVTASEPQQQLNSRVTIFSPLSFHDAEHKPCFPCVGWMGCADRPNRRRDNDWGQIIMQEGKQTKPHILRWPHSCDAAIYPHQASHLSEWAMAPAGSARVPGNAVGPLPWRWPAQLDQAAWWSAGGPSLPLGLGAGQDRSTCVQGGLEAWFGLAASDAEASSLPRLGATPCLRWAGAGHPAAAIGRAPGNSSSRPGP